MLDRERLLELLGDLATELDAEGILGDMFVVGGAAMALATAPAGPPETWTPSLNPMPPCSLSGRGLPYGSSPRYLFCEPVGES